MPAQIVNQKWCDIARQWRQWTDIVGLFARHDLGRLHVDAAGYEALHLQLSQACAAGLAVADEAMHKRLQRAVDLTKPWLTAHSLEMADRDILLGLWRHCQSLDEEFKVHDRGRGWRGMGKPLLAFAAIAVAACVFGATAEWTWTPVSRWAVGVWETAWSVFRRLSEVEQWLAVGVTVFVGALLVLARTSRS